MRNKGKIHSLFWHFSLSEGWKNVNTRTEKQAHLGSSQVRIFCCSVSISGPDWCPRAAVFALSFLGAYPSPLCKGLWRKTWHLWFLFFLNNLSSSISKSYKPQTFTNSCVRSSPVYLHVSWKFSLLFVWNVLSSSFDWGLLAIVLQGTVSIFP